MSHIWRRDIVEGSITLNGVAINFIDTAGIRKTEDIVEKIGVDKSQKTADNSDLILLVLNNNEELSNEEKELLNKYNSDRLIIFINKNDLINKLVVPEEFKSKIIYGNTIDVDGLDILRKTISEKLNLESIVSKDMSYLSNIRQIDLVNKANSSIENANNALANGMPIDIIEIDLKSAWEYLGKIIGDSYQDELIDVIFRNFCLGK